MKPVLFPANATTYTSNGIGRLEPTSCTVVEERNGQYELACTVPVDSPHFADIRINMILAVVPSDGATVQAFRIYQINEPLNGLVTIAARHISYDLSYNTVMPFTASTCAAALVGLNTYAVETQPFSFWTDKSVTASFKVSTPQPIRACLGGQQGSVLDVYGGVYEWDNWTVKLWNQRGSDNGVTLRYGKNITDLSQEQNLESVVTGIVPFWASEDTIVTLPEKSVDSTYASQYPYKRTVPVDFSSDWDDAPTEAQLRARAQAYITANNIGVPKVSIKVSFVALWQTEEYKDIAPLERVHLCDTVHIVFERYGIDASAEVVRTEWDCLTERYLSIELGEARSNLASTLVKIEDYTDQRIAESSSELQKAIDRATEVITGQKGGYLKINSDGSDRPYELLIMDQPAQADAQKLWRWNLGGLGYSKTGYAGPYGTAITMAGEIVADYITTGKLTADVIQAGILTDLAGKFSLNMVTGALTMNDGTFKGTMSAGKIQIDADNFWDLNNNTFNVSTVSGTKSWGIYVDPTHFQLFASDSSQSLPTSNYWHLHNGAFRVGGPTNTSPHIYLASGASGAAFEIYADANNYWDLKTGVFKTNSGTFSGSISASTITGSSVTVGGSSGSKLVIDSSTGRMTSYYNDSATGYIAGATNANSHACIAMVVTNSYYGVTCAANETIIGNCDIFNSPNGIICGSSGVEIYANGGIKIDGTSVTSGSFVDKNGKTVTVTKGLITDIF
jgi:phage minor structural protein